MILNRFLRTLIARMDRCCPGENRPIYNKVEHPIERLSR